MMMAGCRVRCPREIRSEKNQDDYIRIENSGVNI